MNQPSLRENEHPGKGNSGWIEPHYNSVAKPVERWGVQLLQHRERPALGQDFHFVVKALPLSLLGALEPSVSGEDSVEIGGLVIESPAGSQPSKVIR